MCTVDVSVLSLMRVIGVLVGVSSTLVKPSSLSI